MYSYPRLIVPLWDRAIRMLLVDKAKDPGDKIHVVFIQNSRIQFLNFFVISLFQLGYNKDLILLCFKHNTFEYAYNIYSII